MLRYTEIQKNQDLTYCVADSVESTAKSRDVSHSSARNRVNVQIVPEEGQLKGSKADGFIRNATGSKYVARLGITKEQILNVGRSMSSFGGSVVSLLGECSYVVDSGVDIEAETQPEHVIDSF